MASLGEVYGARGPRQLWAGVGLFVVGAVLVFCGIVVATTDLATRAGYGMFEARELAGLLAGVGLPAASLGVFAVLPASRRVRAAAVAGTAVALVGVALFTWAYPNRWVGASGPTHYTLPVVAVYSAGLLTSSLCLFWAVATFKARNDPGGTVRLEVTDAGTRVVSVSGPIRRRLGGVGFLGSTPDGDASTQTARPVSDGGSAAAEGAELLTETPDPRGPLADPYCGNCEQFRYVRVGGEIQPYCGLRDELMDDMEACDDWAPNTDS